MKKQIMALTALVLFGMSSCKDDKTVTPDTPPKTRSEILTEEVWNLDSVSTETYVNDVKTYFESEVYIGMVQFGTDGKVTSKIPGEEDDVQSYTLKGDSIHFEDISMYIVTLNEDRMELYTEEIEDDAFSGGRIVSQITTVLKR